MLGCHFSFINEILQRAVIDNTKTVPHHSLKYSCLLAVHSWTSAWPKHGFSCVVVRFAAVSLRKRRMMSTHNFPRKEIYSKHFRTMHNCPGDNSQRSLTTTAWNRSVQINHFLSRTHRLPLGQRLAPACVFFSLFWIIIWSNFSQCGCYSSRKKRIQIAHICTVVVTRCGPSGLKAAEDHVGFGFWLLKPFVKVFTQCLWTATEGWEFTGKACC